MITLSRTTGTASIFRMSDKASLGSLVCILLQRVECKQRLSEQMQFRYLSIKATSKFRKTRVKANKPRRLQPEREQEQSKIDSTTFLSKLDTYLRPIRYKEIVVELSGDEIPKDVQIPTNMPSFLRPILKRVDEQNQYYTNEHLLHLLYRLPFAVLLVGTTMYMGDEVLPYRYSKIVGPSMIPTFYPDSSEIYLTQIRSNSSIWKWIRTYIYNTTFKLQKGIIVGYNHPSDPWNISVKRIIGLPGDTVQRYGQYVQELKQSDHINWGMYFPSNQQQQLSSSITNNNVDNVDAEKINRYDWLDYDFKWDTIGYEKRLRYEQDILTTDATRGSTSTDSRNGRWEYDNNDSTRKIVVPDGHVWVESDCPSFGIDSRQIGPIPIEWIRLKVVNRIWPMSYRNMDDKRNVTDNLHGLQSPSAILNTNDKEELMAFNLFKIKEQKQQSTTKQETGLSPT